MVYLLQEMEHLVIGMVYLVYEDLVHILWIYFAQSNSVCILCGRQDWKITLRSVVTIIRYITISYEYCVCCIKANIGGWESWEDANVWVTAVILPFDHLPPLYYAPATHKYHIIHNNHVFLAFSNIAIFVPFNRRSLLPHPSWQKTAYHNSISYLIDITTTTIFIKKSVLSSSWGGKVVGIGETYLTSFPPPSCILPEAPTQPTSPNIIPNLEKGTTPHYKHNFYTSKRKLTFVLVTFTFFIKTFTFPLIPVSLSVWKRVQFSPFLLSPLITVDFMFTYK